MIIYRYFLLLYYVLLFLIIYSLLHIMKHIIYLEYVYICIYSIYNYDDVHY